MKCSLHHKKSDVIQFLTAHILIINAQRFKLKKGQKKTVIGLKGSSYHSQELCDLTNVNELIKIFGMIPFTYEKHLKENNSITILKAVTQ